MSASFLSGFYIGLLEVLEERSRQKLGTPDLKYLQKETPLLGGSYVKGRCFGDAPKESNRAYKCSYCLNIYQEQKETCPTCGAREFQRI